MSKLRFGWKPTASILGGMTPAPTGRARRISSWGSPHPRSTRQRLPRMPVPPTSARVPSGRRRPRPTPTRRSGSKACARSARRSASRSWRSAGSTPPTPPTASEPARRASQSSAPRETRPPCGRRSMRLSDLGEPGLLAALERRGLARGIADDAAQLADGVVVTQDALVEGVHFRLDWTSHRELGYKAAAVSLSDLAASGAYPEALLVTLAAPPETRLEDVIELYEGLNEPG